MLERISSRGATHVCLDTYQIQEICALLWNSIPKISTVTEIYTLLSLYLFGNTNRVSVQLLGTCVA